MVLKLKLQPFICKAIRVIIDINKRIYNELVDEFDEVYIINLKNILFIKKKGIVKKITEKTTISKNPSLDHMIIGTFWFKKSKDFFDLEPPVENAFLILNPPYNMRIAQEKNYMFYEKIGTRLKHSWSGSDAWILSGDLEGLKHIGLRPIRKIKLFNR